MLFNSLHYLLFAPIVITLYFVLPEKLKKTWLLLTSLYFYAIFRIPFIFILIIDVVLTYILTIQLEKNEGIKKKIYLWLAIAVNSGILFGFKYLDFFIRATNLFLGLTPCEPDFLKPTGLILPMGISFFTLQAMAYSVDVYRGIIPASKSLFDFTLFISFFPQLVAGPIMRAKDLIDQFRERHIFNREDFEAGLRLIAWGFFKKSFIADPFGQYVDSVFNAPSQYDWFSILLSGYLHMIQIYCDFSGYSDIAIGSGRIMGFRIRANFARPFLSESVTDLWRRWHISLSKWLRDYIYITLGGNRVSPSRAYFNVLATWMTGGIWHGADWTYVFWGALQAVAIIGERMFFSVGIFKKAFDAIPGAGKAFYSATIFSLGMLFFRARPVEGIQEGIQVSFYMFQRIFTLQDGIVLIPSYGLILLFTILIAAEMIIEKDESYFDKLFSKKGLTYITSGIVIVTCAIIYSVTTSQQFIYFQF